MRTQGTALWLVPDGPEAQAMSALIGELSARFGTPTFAPHVTLLAVQGSEAQAVLEGGRELARSIQDFSVRFDGLEHSADYLRALVVRIAPDLPILDARRRAQAAFPSEPVGPFVPHLSLLYGSLPVETRRHLTAEVRESAPASIVLRGLQVMSIDGTPGEWRPLGRFRLSPAQDSPASV
jgi:2'-5' RNA ligase